MKHPSLFTALQDPTHEEPADSSPSPASSSGSEAAHGAASAQDSACAASRCQHAEGSSGPLSGGLLEDALGDAGVKAQLARIARLVRGRFTVRSPRGSVLLVAGDGQGSRSAGLRELALDGLVLGHVVLDRHDAGPDAEDALDAVAHALSERLHAETDKNVLAGEILGKLQELNMLYDVAGTLARVGDIAQVGREVLSHASEVLSPDFGGFVTYDAARGRSRVLAATGSSPGKLGWQPVERDSLTWQAMNRAEPVLLTEMTDTEREALRREFGSAADDAGSVLVVPTRAADEAMGVILLINGRNRPPFSSVDARRMTALAAQAAVSTRHLRLYEESKEIFLSTVWALAAAVDAKDGYTHGHSQRVAQYAVTLGRELGFDQQEVERLELSAVLHDVGKIGVPEAVLNKPGRLTTAEMTIMRTHPEKGADILSSIRAMRDIVPGVRHHHERFDGMGYPDGLKGGNIPLSARIILVADTFDAMTSTRPYRTAMPVRAAHDEIARCSGTQFDPRLAEVFMDLIVRDVVRPLEEAPESPPSVGGDK